MTYDNRHTGITLGLHQGVPYTLDPEARRRHLHIIGQTGVGKTTLLLNMLAADLAAGRGVGIIDPLGSLAEPALALIPSHRARDVIYLNPSDRQHPLGFNLLQHAHPDQHANVADDIVSAAVHVWGETAVGARSQQILRNSVRALLDTPGSTLLGIPRLLLNPEYRARIVRRIRDPVVLTFWREQFQAWVDQRLAAEYCAPILNKLGEVLEAPDLRNILGQPHSTFDLRKTMDDGRIIIINLSKIGEANAHILGALLVTAISQAAFARADTDRRLHRPFYLYTDEFQSYASGGFNRILSQARNVSLILTLAHQYLGQLTPHLRQAVMGTAANFIAFRVGAEDAPLIANHLTLAPELEYMAMGNREIPAAHRLINLPQYRSYLRVPDNATFSGGIELELMPPPVPCNHKTQHLISRSRRCFGRNRAKVEAKIARFLSPSTTAPRAKTLRKKGQHLEDIKNTLQSIDRKLDGTNDFRKKTRALFP